MQRTSEVWPEEKRREYRAMAMNTFYPAEHAAGRPIGHVRANCGACVLRGYISDSARADGHIDIDGPNYAGWARIYVEASITVPAKWRAAFQEQRDSDNTAYAHALEVSINTYGVRFSDGLNIDPLTREDIPDNAFYQRMKQGHRTRCGHELTGYLTTEGGISTLVRTCCN